MSNALPTRDRILWTCSRRLVDWPESAFGGCDRGLDEDTCREIPITGEVAADAFGWHRRIVEERRAMGMEVDGVGWRLGVIGRWDVLPF
jgi:hypothetical protein